MSQVHYGTKVCTTNCKYYIYWPATSETGDFRMSHKVAQWVNQNEKAMKKKTLPQQVKEIQEQFGSVSEIRVESRNNFGDIVWLKE